MSHAFADIAFTPAVSAAQTRDGSRANCARGFEHVQRALDERDQRIAALEARIAALAGRTDDGHAAGPPVPS